MKKIIILFMVLVLSQYSFAQQGLPIGFEEKVRKEYNHFLVHQEDSTGQVRQIKLTITFEQFFNYKREQYLSKQRFYQKVAQQKSSSDLCSNGTFESGQINPTDWNFYWRGGTTFTNPNPVFSGQNMANTGSFNTFAPHASQVHHSAVTSGPDPIVGTLLNTVWNQPSSNTTSVRLGNAINGNGLESMAKQITVTSNNSSLTFAYAMVLQNPTNQPHDDDEVPSFRLNIIDANDNTDYSYLVDLGSGANVILSNNTSLNPGNVSNPPYVMYKPWDCVTVDLTRLLGKTIIIEFENRDCELSGHWSYTYIDNICLACNGNIEDGSISLSAESDSCSLPGEICVNYTVPNGNNPSTELKLELIQNGIVVATYSTIQFTSDGSYCFNLPSIISNLDYTLSGFDYKVTGYPRRGTATLAPRFIGNTYQGAIQGQNNDYLINCSNVSTNVCCQVDLEIFNAAGTPNPLPITQSVHHGIPISYAKETFVIHTNSTIPITDLRVAITDIQYNYNYDACATCVNNPALWGTIIAPVNPIGGANGLSHQNPEYMTTTGSLITNFENKREILWTNPQGAMLHNGDQFEVHYVLPPASEIPCCATSVKICTNISWKDANCNVCDDLNTCSVIELSSSAKNSNEPTN